MMRVLVCGGRNFADRDAVFRVLDRLHENRHISMLIHGDARGADRLGEEWAKARQVNYIAFPAKWDQHGKRAGFLRNQEMLFDGKPDAVVAFPGGNGTKGMVSLAGEAGVSVWEPLARQ